MFRRRRLSPPSWRAFALSLVLALLAVASLFFAIPVIGHYVNAHRFWFMTGAYVFLAASVLRDF